MQAQRSWDQEVGRLKKLQAYPKRRVREHIVEEQTSMEQQAVALLTFQQEMDSVNVHFTEDGTPRPGIECEEVALEKWMSTSSQEAGWTPETSTTRMASKWIDRISSGQASAGCGVCVLTSRTAISISG